MVIEVEDWSMGSTLHSEVLKQTSPSRMTSRLGKGWEKEMFIRPSNVSEEVAGAFEELGRSLFVSTCTASSSSSYSMKSPFSSSET